MWVGHRFVFGTYMCIPPETRHGRLPLLGIRQTRVSYYLYIRYWCGRLTYLLFIMEFVTVTELTSLPVEVKICTFHT